MYIGPWQEYRLARAVRGRRKRQIEQATNVQLHQYYTRYQQMCEQVGEAEAMKRMVWDPIRQTAGGRQTTPHSGLGTSHSTRSAPATSLAQSGHVRYPSATPWDARSAGSERPWQSGASARSHDASGGGGGLESGRSSRSMPPATVGNGGFAGAGAGGFAGGGGAVPTPTNMDALNPWVPAQRQRRASQPRVLTVAEQNAREVERRRQPVKVSRNT